MKDSVLLPNFVSLNLKDKVIIDLLEVHDNCIKNKEKFNMRYYNKHSKYGIIILLNPFETLRVVIIVSGSVLLISELSNIIYSVSVLKFFRKTDKVVKDIIVKEE